MQICAQCHRHVRTLPCPFCEGETAKDTVVAGPSAFRVGIKRSAIIVGVVTATAACGTPMPGPDVITAGDAYGIPADVVPSTDATDVITAADAYGVSPDAYDVVTAADAYGIPDALPREDVVSEDAAGPAPAYGVFPVDVVTAADAYGIPDR